LATKTPSGPSPAARLGEQPRDVLRPRHVGLEQDRFGAALAQQMRGLRRGVPVLQVVHADPGDAALGEPERDPAADPARTAGDQCGPGLHLYAAHGGSPLSLRSIQPHPGE
jgi:hypothetical protein